MLCFPKGQYLIITKGFWDLLVQLPNAVNLLWREQGEKFTVYRRLLQGHLSSPPFERFWIHQLTQDWWFRRRGNFFVLWLKYSLCLLTHQVYPPMKNFVGCLPISFEEDLHLLILSPTFNHYNTLTLIHVNMGCHLSSATHPPGSSHSTWDLGAHFYCNLSHQHFWSRENSQ